MKKIFFSLAIMLIVASQSLSANNYPFSVGASISGKMGINAAAVPDGVQNALSFAIPDVGILGYLPMSDESRTGLFVELGYTNSPFGFKGYQENITWYYNQKFFTVSPYLLMSGFTVGLDFGFALGGTVKIDGKTTKFDSWNNDLNVNLRVGGMIPIHTTSVGTLNFIINGTYLLTGSDYSGNYTYNPSSLGIGFNYLFNLERGGY